MALSQSNMTALHCVLIPVAKHILRSLFQLMMRKLTGKRWENTENDGKNFISSHGKNVWITATSRQKELLEFGNVDIWDFKLLNHIFQNLKLKKKQKTKIRFLYDTYNNILRDNTLTDREFIRVKEMVENIKSLIDEHSELMEKMSLIDEYETSISKLLAEDLKKAGNMLCSKKNFSAAIDSYTEALKLKCLLKTDLGEFYMKRSELYLNQHSTVKDNLVFFKEKDHKRLALEDAKRAVELRPSCHQAYYHLACAYQACNKFQRALKCVEIACELGNVMPDATTIRQDCEKKLEEMKMTDNPFISGIKHPQNEREMWEEFNKRSGLTVNVEKMIQLEKELADKNSPNGLVHQAHKYMIGFEVEKNCKLGIELYEKAAKDGNIEAIYNLGVIYRDGKQVKKDVQKALKYLNDAANASNATDMGFKPIGISEAQFQLGCMYRKGIGVSRDFEKSITYFLQSSGNGNHLSANVLGKCYFNGDCVEKDIDKAVQFWNLAAERYDIMAMQSLAEYYLVYDVDPDKALDWHCRAIEMGNLIAKSQSKEFISMVDQSKTKLKTADEEMIRWEKKNGLTGLCDSMKERRRKFIDSKLPGCTKFGENLKSFKGAAFLPMEFSNDKREELNLDIIDQFIQQGSVTAKEIREAFLHFERAKTYLMCVDHDCWRIIVHELAECIRITDRVVRFDYQTHSVARNLVNSAMKSIDSKVKSQIDKDLRVCYVALNANSMYEVIKLLEESRLKYPDDVWFHHILCSFVGFLHQHERGLQMADEALAKYPDDVKFLYSRLSHIRNVPHIDTKKSIEAHEKFLAVAPPDHIRVPEVYYTIACELVKSAGGVKKLTKLKQKERLAILDLVAKNYTLGMESEKKQIPFFLSAQLDQKRFLDEMMSLQAFKDAVNRYQSPEASGVKKSENKDERNCGIDKERLKKLTNPRRETIIKDHRGVISSLKLSRLMNSFTTSLALTAKFEQKGPKQLAEVKSITLRDMEPFKERVYKGFALKCEIIDEPTLGFASVGIIIEDENGDVERVGVYDIKQDKEVHNKIGYGCKITILNPYFKVALDGKQVIRVDDVESLIFDAGPDLSRCRYCGKTGAVKRCGDCHKACYCSKECQVGDWKKLKHKLVCGSL